MGLRFSTGGVAPEALNFTTMSLTEVKLKYADWRKRFSPRDFTLHRAHYADVRARSARHAHPPALRSGASTYRLTRSPTHPLQLFEVDPEVAHLQWALFTRTEPQGRAPRKVNGLMVFVTITLICKAKLAEKLRCVDSSYMGRVYTRETQRDNAARWRAQRAASRVLRCRAARCHVGDISTGCINPCIIVARAGLEYRCFRSD